MKKFKKTISRGLPGGPNEEITEITGAISVEGYKISSPDKDNTFNIIPSSNISMKDVEFPILGTDNLGNSQVMMPGAQYTFPGDMVVELPMMADGGRCWPGYKPVSGKLAYSKGSCEKAQDGEEIKEKYYNPEIEKDITSGDWKQDLLYRNQWLMDVPYLGDYIKNKAKEIASTSQEPTRADYELTEEHLDYRKQQGNMYDGSEDGGSQKINLLDEYFSEEPSLPLSPYKPVSDYLEFLPSYSIKDKVDEDDNIAKDRDSAIQRAFVDILKRKEYGSGDDSGSFQFAKDRVDSAESYKDSEVTEAYNQFLKDKKPIFLTHKQSSPLQKLLGVNLAGHKTGMAWDEEVGLPYISISDAWDFSPDHYSEKWTGRKDGRGDELLRQRSKIQSALMHKAGNPFKIYDRFYFEPKEDSIKYYTDKEVEQLRDSKKQEGGEQQTRSQLRDQISQLYQQLEEEQNRVNDIRSRVPQVSEEIDIADSKIIERINNPVTKDDQKLVELWENYKYANNPKELAAARNALPQQIKDVLPEEGKYNVASYSYKDDTWKGGQDPSRELYCTPFGCFPYQKAGATDVDIIGGNYTFTEGAYGSGYKTAGNVPFEKVSVENAEPGDIAIQYNSAPLEYTMSDAPQVFRPHHTTILNKKAEYDDGTPYIEVYNAQGGSRLYFGKDEFELGPSIESGDDRNDFSEQHEFYRYVGQTPKIQKQIDDLKELYMQAPEEKIPTLSALKGETVNLNIPNQIQAEPLNTRVIIPQSTSKRKKRRQYGAEILKKQNDILRRQAFAESSFNPSAESPAGAQGLTQFTPTTVKELQRLGFVNEDFDIFNPQQAVEAQKAYMTYIQNKPYIAKGSDEVQLAKALYAYNRGPSGALKNLTKLKGKYDIYNSLDWLEGINAESRDYIQKILGQNPEFNIQYKQALESKDYRPIVDLYQAGGESNMFKIYKDFIMGEFDTSESYPEAEKVFDRLNRVYYKEAKEAGMSPANYIMTNIVTS